MTDLTSLPEGTLPRISGSVEDAAEASGVGRSMLFKAIKEGRLPARKLGRRTVIYFADLDAFVRGLPVKKTTEAPEAV